MKVSSLIPLVVTMVFTLGLFVSLPNPVHSMSSSALGSEIPCADEMNAYLQCLGEEFNNCFQNEAGPDPEDEFAPCGNLESGDFCHNLFMCSAITVTEDCWIEAKYLEECAETDGQSCARMVCTPTSMGGILSLQ